MYAQAEREDRRYGAPIGIARVFTDRADRVDRRRSRPVDQWLLGAWLALCGIRAQ
jgi:hypothetical protein